MSTIDKQRIAAVRKLEQLGYAFAGDDWMHPANDAASIAPTITDELHAMLVKNKHWARYVSMASKTA